MSGATAESLARTGAPSTSGDESNPAGLRPGVHFPALDGYRAVAALLVLLTHVALASGLNARSPVLAPYLARADVGVSIFFLLSGFLLYRPFVAARFADQPTGDLGRYMRRRVLRILPAYWVALTVVAFVLRAPEFTDRHSLVALYMLLHVYDVHQVIGGPVQQSWSLATELAFYAFLPIWAWLLGRTARRAAGQMRVEFLALAGLWAAAVLLKLVALWAGVDGEHFGQYGTWLPFRLDEFALGMAMAVASAWLVHRRVVLPAWVGRWWATALSWSVAALLFWFTCTQLDLPPSPRFTSRQALVVRLLYAFIALFLLLPGVFGPRDRGPVRVLLQNRVMIWLGLVSYGIYIWHEAWLEKWLEWRGDRLFDSAFGPMLVATVALTLASAAASWYLVERPALRRAHRDRT